ncbi:MAG: DUF488 family protein [Solirubrobacteraceae bacterium]|nr:DUF488 family protein [Solirubrobacteraceae bacterium]
MDVRCKRAYDEAADADGRRVLVDRMWPRGVERKHARIDDWQRDLAPSNELRRWFGHDPDRFEEFEARYRAELEERRDALTALRRHARDGRLTLVYAAKDEERNNAVVLAKVLRGGL